MMSKWQTIQLSPSVTSKRLSLSITLCVFLVYGYFIQWCCPSSQCTKDHLSSKAVEKTMRKGRSPADSTYQLPMLLQVARWVLLRFAREYLTHKTTQRRIMWHFERNSPEFREQMRVEHSYVSSRTRISQRSFRQKEEPKILTVRRYSDIQWFLQMERKTRRDDLRWTILIS